MGNCTSIVQCPSGMKHEYYIAGTYDPRWKLQSNFDISGTGVRSILIIPAESLFFVVIARAEGTDIDIGGHKLHGYGLPDPSTDHSTLHT